MTSPGSAFSVRPVDLSTLELELLKLASETSVLDKRDVGVICESVKKCIDAYHNRLTHKAHIIEVLGESYRFRQRLLQTDVG